MWKRFFMSLLLASTLIVPMSAHAQETLEVRARVTSVTEETVDDATGLLIDALGDDGRTYNLHTIESHPEGIGFDVSAGDRIIVTVLSYPDGERRAFFTDAVRDFPLAIIILLFAATAIIIGRLRGAAALVGLMMTMGIIFLFILPQILKGNDPVTMAAIGSLMILTVNMFLSHGFNRETAGAYAGTVAGLALVVIVSTLLTAFAKLSGLSTEEIIKLSIDSGVSFNAHGILLAGIILGAVGVLDDVAVAQSETVAELIAADQHLTRKELFVRAMRVGRHHIASTVNTLVLAYAGASLPLLLLLLHFQGDISFGRFLTSEPIAEEVVRTIAGTIALMLTVPIATWFATIVQKR